MAPLQPGTSELERKAGMIDTLGLGIKGGLALAVVLAIAYLVFTWRRLRRIPRRKSVPQARRAPSRTPPSLVAADDDLDDDPEEMLDAVIYTRPRPTPAASRPAAPPSAADPGFAALLGDSRDKRESRDTEVQSLRIEVASLRQTLAELQDELERLKAAQNVSPLYNEAVGLAQHGLDAAGIADRCGISIAEAQLVAALAGGRERRDETYDDYGTGNDHGNSGQKFAA